MNLINNRYEMTEWDDDGIVIIDGPVEFYDTDELPESDLEELHSDGDAIDENGIKVISVHYSNECNEKFDNDVDDDMDHIEGYEHNDKVSGADDLVANVHVKSEYEGVEFSDRISLSDDCTNMSEHYATMRNHPNGDGYFYCDHCHLAFDSIEDFTLYHSESETHRNDDDDDDDADDNNDNGSSKSFAVIEYGVQEEEETEDEKPNLSELNLKLEPLESVTTENINDPLDENDLRADEINDEDNTNIDNIFIKAEDCDDLCNSENNLGLSFCYDCQTIFKESETHLCSAQKIVEPETEPNPDPESTEGSTYNCKHCHKVLKTPLGLENHQRNCVRKILLPEVENNKYTCSICSKGIANKKNLVAHMREHEKTEESSQLWKVECDICHTIFKSPKNLKLHRKIHNKKPIRSIRDVLPAGVGADYNAVPLFFCEICNKSFDHNLLAVHRSMHQDVEQHTCNICNKIFENMPSYEMHMKLHADKPPERRARSKLANGNTKLRFACNYCGHLFSRPYEKVKHERIHTGEKPYNCEVCGKKFRVSYSLTLHLRTHTDIRPYVCPTCNKRFKSYPVYTHHLNSHLSERQYKCNRCPKMFRTSVQLCAHKNSHTKPFNCIECNRPFATLYAVKLHMKSHNAAKSNGKMKFRCVVCGAVYGRGVALRGHIMEQHPVVFERMKSGDLTPSSFGQLDEDAILISAAAEASQNTIGMVEEEVVVVHNTDIVQVDDNNQDFFADDIIKGNLQNEEEIIIDYYQEEEIISEWVGDDVPAT